MSGVLRVFASVRKHRLLHCESRPFAWINLAVLLVLQSVSLNSLTQESDQFSTANSIAFIENKQQIKDQNGNRNSNVEFLLPLNGMNVQIRKNGFSYDTYQREFGGDPMELEPGERIRLNDEQRLLHFQRIDFDFVNGDHKQMIKGEHARSDYLNFYNEVTPEEGATFVKQFQTIVIQDVFPSIDLRFYTTSEDGVSVKYDWVLHPGANIEDIRLRIQGAQPTIEQENLHFHTDFGELIETIPVSYWQDSHEEVEIRYHLTTESDSTTILGYDGVSGKVEQTLIIDPNPNLNWSTYYGGTSLDVITDVSTYGNNAIYTGGFTQSLNSIATAGAHKSSLGDPYGDGFVVKFNSSGVRQWGTYYGGGGNDQGWSVATDGSGNVYFAGHTESGSGIATTGAHQTTFGGGYDDAFLVKFNPSGVRQWGTYIGGNDVEQTHEHSVDCDALNNVFITGHTASTSGIATAGSYKTLLTGYQNAFLIKFNSSGVRQWGTYFGGSNGESGEALEVNSSGEIIVAGNAHSSNGIATFGAQQSTYQGFGDCFVAKFSTSGFPIWGTYYGGTDWDMLLDVSIAANDNIAIAGRTKSPNGIASQNAHQTTYMGNYESFVAVYNSAGSLKWSSYYGDTGDDLFQSVTFDDDDNILCTGLSYSTAGIATSNGFQTSMAGVRDASIVRFSKNGVRQWGTYYGGTDLDDGQSITTTLNGAIYLAAISRSPGGAMSTSGAHQVNYNGGYIDGVLARFNDCLTDNIDSVYGNVQICSGTSTTLAVTGQLNGATNWYWYTDGCGGSLVGTGASVSVSPVDTTTYYVRSEGGTGCNDTGICEGITVYPAAAIETQLNPIALCGGSSATIFGNTVINSGIYQDTVTAIGGCDSIVSVEVVVFPSYNDTLSVLELCAGDSVEVFGNTEGTSGFFTNIDQTVMGCDSITVQELIVHDTFDVHLNTIHICEGETISVFGNTVYQSGTYTNYLQSLHGCDSIIEQEVVVHPMYEATLPEIEICANDSALIFGTYRFDSGTYYDSLSTVSGCDSVIIQSLVVHPVYADTVPEKKRCANEPWNFHGLIITGPGFHSVTLSTAQGCDSVLSVNVIDLPTSYLDLGDYLRCEGENGTFFNDIYFDTATYYDTLTNDWGCDSVLKIRFRYSIPEPHFDVTPEFCPDANDGRIEASADNGSPPYFYIWDTGELEAIIDDKPAGMYTVSIEDALGCTSSGSVSIPRAFESCDTTTFTELWLPNIFSPNGDGENDIFKVNGSGISSMQLTIFDRWGHALFESTSQAVGWNGNSNGKPVDPGVYVYTLKVIDSRGEEIKESGTVGLVR